MRSRLFKEVFLPESKALEGHVVAYIVCENTAVGATVEGEAYRRVLLLTGGVPNLQVNFTAVNRQLLGLKVGADCGLGGTDTARTLGELFDESGLADVHVAEKDHLCQELLLMS